MCRPTSMLCCLLTAALLLGAPFARANNDDPSLERTAHPEPPAALGVGRLVPDFSFTALDGSTSTLSALARTRRATVLCATSVTCPLSIRYAPRLASLAREFSSRDVQFVFVNVSDTDTPPEMREQANTISWPGAYLPDASRLTRATLGIRTTTEVFVLDAARTLVYRGAVDDQYGVGTALPTARTPWLRNALESHLADRRVDVPATWPPGCIVEAPKNVSVQAAPITYHNTIARIVQNRCLDCHRHDGGAPFRLDSYDAVAGRGAMIKALVSDSLMPPWHAAPVSEGELSPWANDRSLSAQDRADLLAWIDSDRPMGDQADAPLVRRYPKMWTIGQPDLTLTSPTMSVPAEGALRYADIILPTGLSQERWLTAIEVRPMSHGVFQHAVIYLLPSDPAATRSDEFSDFIAHAGMGDPRTEFPAGSALRIPAGARLLVHVYFISGQQDASERISVGMKFAPEPPLAMVRNRAPGVEALTIPAGVAKHEAVATITLDHDTIITAFAPALRARARSARYDAVLPDGTARTLLDIPRYEYRWRERYVLRDPLTLPAGTRLTFRAVFDNSTANPDNPNPGAAAKWGWESHDEIMLGFFETLSAREP